MKTRQWFKSSVGLGAETARDISFANIQLWAMRCMKLIMHRKQDFANNPLVKPDIRFYAGAPLQDANGFNLGSFVSLTKPRILSNEQKNRFKIIG
jgi:hypothetical protein